MSKSDIYLDDLVQRYRDGDDTVRDEIMLLCRPQALRLVRRHCRACPTRSDDIRSMAVLSLVRAVITAQTGLEDNNIRPYLTTCIRGYVRDYMAKDSLIPIPKKVWAAMVKEYGDKATDHIMHQALLIDVDLIPVMVKEDSYQDMLRELAPTYREKAVLELRMERRTLQEIGEILDVSHVTIYNIIQDLQGRYLRACRRNPNLPRPK